MKIDDIINNDLTKEIRTFTDFDDVDWPPGTGFLGQHNFSALNKLYLRKNFLSIVNNCKAILEIGVLRDDVNLSSTDVFLKNKNKETFYFGVDMDDRSYLDDEEKNVFTIKNNSSNIDEIMDFVKSKGVNEFGFIFIDGWHSINQVLDDWRFTEYLSKDGIVGFHDTNVHPGPKEFINALDTEKYYVDKKCTTLMMDWGISFVKRK